MKGLALFPLLTLTVRQKSLIFGVEIIATLRFALPFFLCVCLCVLCRSSRLITRHTPPHRLVIFSTCAALAVLLSRRQLDATTGKHESRWKKFILSAVGLLSPPSDERWFHSLNFHIRASRRASGLWWLLLRGDNTRYLRKRRPSFVTPQGMVVVT